MDFVLEKYVDSTLCDEIIKEFDLQTAEWSNSIRGYWVVSSSNMNSDLIEQYEAEISKIITEYKYQFQECFNGFETMALETPYNFQKYTPGHHYSRWHCENNGKNPFDTRVLAFMTYLNTVNDGGETEFLYQNAKIKPKKGKTLVWPAYFTHTHRGLPSNTKTKYIVTGWVKFEPWEDVNLDEDDAEFFKNLDLSTRVTW